MKTILITLAALILAPSMTFAIVVDGKFDPNEGYTNVTNLFFYNETTPNQVAPTPGKLYTHVDAQGNVYAAFVVPLSFSDNTYGTNAIGWSGGHTFPQLLLSDYGGWQFKNADGQIVLDFHQDYIARTGGTGSPQNPSPDSTFVAGAPTGSPAAVSSSQNDSKMITGSASNILAVGTSLAYNFNELGYKLLQNSPSASVVTDGQSNIDYSQGYTLTDPAYSGWIYEMVFEVKIAAAAFGPSGFSQAILYEMHASPSKGGGSFFVIPEPSTYLMGAGILLLIGLKERGRLRRLWARD